MINTLLPNVRGSHFFNRNLDSMMVREDLQSAEFNRQRNAMKQIIAFMTMGKDMSMHFNDVASLVSHRSLELKKMAYLFLIQHSRLQPEKAVLQAGTFSHDSQHESPIIRGLALRTMSSMLVVAMADFMLNPILRCLRDTDPFVRRTAVFAALKLHTIAPQNFQESGIAAALVELLADPVASVVASVVAVITELISQSGYHHTALRQALHQKMGILMSALWDCSEWQQYYLLEGLCLLLLEQHRQHHGSAAAANPPPISLDEAEVMATRVIPHLSSGNVAVVASAIRLLVIVLQKYVIAAPMPTPKLAQMESKFAARVVQPMMSLVNSSRFEVRFIALRTLQLFLASPRFRDRFASFVSSFFVKFDDATFVKREKLDVLVGLVSKTNWEIVVAELVEYTSEVDVDFVRKAVRSLGMVAVKVEVAAATCVEKLMALIDTKVNYVVQESAVVVQMILRQYGDRFDGVIAQLCSAISVLDNAESKSAVAWVIGEFADRIINAPEVLALFLETFHDEPSVVQLSVVTAVVKTFLLATDVDHEKSQRMLTHCLQLATNAQHPDVRDRAYFYWRIIAADPHSAKEVILGKKPPMTDFVVMDRSLWAELIVDLGRVSAVLHVPKRSLFLGERGQVDPTLVESDDDEDDAGNVGSGDGVAKRDAAESQPHDNVYKGTEGTIPVAGGSAAPPSVPVSPTTSSAVPVSNLDYTVVLPAIAGSGVEVAMAWSQNGTLPVVNFRFYLRKSSTATGAVSDGGAAAHASMVSVVRVVMIQLNVNVFGLGIAQEMIPKEIKAGEYVHLSLAVNCNNGRKPVRDVQTAVKLEPLGVLYFNAPPIPPRFVLLPATGIDPVAYVTAFKSLNPTWTLPVNLENKYRTSSQKFSTSALRVNQVVLVHSKETPPRLAAHLFCETIARQKIYVEVTVTDWFISSLSVRSTDENVSHIIGEYLIGVLAGE